MQTKTVDVTELIDSRKLSKYQIGIAVICFLIVAIDGFDTAAIGFLAPALAQEWGINPSQLGPLFGAGLAGLMAGAFICGPLADRFGRKYVLLGCVLFFGTMSVLSAFSESLGMLVLLRFLTGLGLGGAMPCTITLTSEYCPKSRRSLLVTTMFCGFTIGSALGGLVSAQMVEALGWRSVLMLGGVLPLALVPIIWWKLPESVRFLVMKGKKPQQVARALKSIAPDADLTGATFVLPHESAGGSPIRRLFERDLIRQTALLWVAYFMSLLVIYLLSSWLPTLISSAGVSLKTASIVTAMFQIGGTLGSILMGVLMDRFQPQRVLAVTFLIGAASIALIGGLSTSPWLVGLAIFVVGVCISGGQTGTNAFAAVLYPTDCRSTGVGWANGVGRTGSIVGAMSGGLMMTMGWSLSAVFVAVAIPAVVAAGCYLLLGRSVRPVQEAQAAGGQQLQKA